jgi:hypothetical protein
LCDDDLALRSTILPRGAGIGSRAHAVGVRLRQVLLARQHLQVPQPEEHDREQRERDGAEIATRSASCGVIGGGGRRRVPS